MWSFPPLRQAAGVNLGYANQSRVRGLPCRRLRTAAGVAAIQSARKGNVVEVGDTTVHDRGPGPRIMSKSCMQRTSSKSHIE